MEEFFHEYTHLMGDLPHLMVEITFMVLIDGLFLGILWPLIRRSMDRRVDARVKREHAILDAEHGVVHPGAGIGDVPAKAGDVTLLAAQDA